MSARNWGEVGVLAMARMSMGAQLQAIGALGPLLVGTLVVDWASLGTLMGAYSLAGIVVALPAGMLLARFSVRAVLLAGVGLMGLCGILLAMAPDVTAALLGRIVSGVGGTLLTITGAKMVLDRFSGPTVAMAMGLMLMAWPFGIGLALLVAPLFGSDWRAGLWASALFCCLAFVLVLLTVRTSPSEAVTTARFGLHRSEWAPLLGIGLLWAGYNATFAVAVVFAAAGVTGALIGSTAAKSIDGTRLLALFGALMIVVGMAMFLKRKTEGDPNVRLTRETAAHLLPWLLGGGLGVGLLSGFFGIGGGFLIVPALMVATGMSLPFADRNVSHRRQRVRRGHGGELRGIGAHRLAHRGNLHSWRRPGRRWWKFSRPAARWA